MQQRFIEFRCDLFSKELRNVIIPMDELGSYIQPEKDCYRSIFHADETIANHVKKTSSISGFSGKVGVDTVVFDFDSLSLEDSRKDALTLIKRLNDKYKIGLESIGIFFSGKKGFSIDFSTNGLSEVDGLLSERVPVLLKQFCTQLAIDLPTFDAKIYQHNRLYRLPGTKHYKPTQINGQDVYLYKTQLTYDQLKNEKIANIQKYSSELRDIDGYDVISDPTVINEEFKRLKAEISSIVKKLPSVNSIVNKIVDEKDCPKYSKVCIWRLSQGTHTDQRDNTLFAIADHEKQQGMPQEVTKGKLLGVLELMNKNDPIKGKLDPMGEKDIERIIRQTYSKDYSLSCSHPTLDSVCSKTCYLAPLKFSDSKVDVVSFGDAYSRSKAFFKDIQNKIVKTGFSNIDINAPLITTTLNLIVAREGSGKSSLVFNMLKNFSDQGESCLFASLDMSEEMSIQRFAPTLYGKEYGELISGKDFMKALSEGNTKVIERMDNIFAKFNEKVRISSQKSLSVKDIENEIESFEQTKGTKVKVLIIDYVQLLKSNTEDDVVKNSQNAAHLTKMADERKMCIIGLSQATNNGEVFNTKGDFFAKGTRAWVEQASTQFNCYRPFINYQSEGYDNIFSLKAVKNRLGPLETFNLWFDGPSGFMRELTPDEEIERQALAQSLKDQDNG